MSNKQSSQFLIFSCNNNYFAVDAQIVERVLRIVETTLVPNSSHILYGIYNLHGKTLPVVSLRRLFSFDEKSVELEDMFIVLHICEHFITLLTDHVSGIFECKKDDTADVKELFPDFSPIEIVKWQERLVPVIDIEELIDEEIFHHVQDYKTTLDKESWHA